MILELADMSRLELIQDIMKMRQHIKDQKDKCQTCRAVITAEIEAGRRSRSAQVDTKKKDIIELQKRGVFVHSSKRSRLVGD